MLRKIAHDQIGHGETDDGVTEELESLVGRDPVLGGVTRVGQSQREYLTLWIKTQSFSERGERREQKAHEPRYATCNFTTT